MTLPQHSADMSYVLKGSLRRRVWTVISSAFAGFLGILPHVLHHAGPLAGAALFAGIGGTLLFGALGLVAAIPFLIRLHRRTGNWRAPVATLALFAAVFSLSAFVIGPEITGNDEKTTPKTSKKGVEKSPQGKNKKSPQGKSKKLPKGHDAHH